MTELVGSHFLDNWQSIVPDKTKNKIIEYLKVTQKPWMMKLKYELSKPALQRAYYVKWDEERREPVNLEEIKASSETRPVKIRQIGYPVTKAPIQDYFRDMILTKSILE